MAQATPEHYPKPDDTDPFTVYGLRFDLLDNPDIWKLTLSQLNERDPFRAQQINVIAEEQSGGDIHIKEGILKGFMLSEELRLRRESMGVNLETDVPGRTGNLVGLSWLRKRRERRQAKIGRHAIGVVGGDAA